MIFIKQGEEHLLCFNRDLTQLKREDYNDAIKYLSEDITEHQNEKSIFYTYYIIGITYLKSSESDFIGLFKSYDEERM